ncbi:MAG: peptidoglycan -binding protein, partial [Flavobacteriaceae bacterium]
TRVISGRETELSRLKAQIAELNELLALERAGKRSLEDTLAGLQESLAGSEKERERLQAMLDAGEAEAGGESDRIGILNNELDAEKQISQRALAQVELLNQQIAALRRQIAALEDALDASEERDRQSQTKIADLGKRLNIALAAKVQELSRYRSDFFGRLREILSQRSDIRVVGDRFVFQAEVLFGSGSDEINAEGREEMAKLADAIKQLEGEIPPEINWVLRVDGHTDKRPINSPRFKSNWELSAARAISVVQFLIAQGVSPNRLVAAGFADNQPLEQGDSDETYARNRRIELKLTER